MSSRIGFFAGSFDPIHDGHLETAINCVKNLDLTCVYFMVESKPWGDKKPVDVIFRREMVDTATSGYSKLSQLQLDDDQFSVDNTLEKIVAKFPGDELYFIFGADIFMNMNKETWPNLSNLLDHYIVVIERKDISEEQIADHAKKLGIVTAIFSSKHLHHSSTDVRLNPHNKSIWVPETVAKYIDINNLY